MNNYRFFLNNTDITDEIISFNYSEDLEDVASNFSFTSIRNYDITSNINNRRSINRISIFDINNRQAPFYVGYIVSRTFTEDRNIFGYSGYDVGFYLNKNKVLYQAKGNIATIIRQLCNNHQITLGSIPNFSQRISKIYKNIDFSEILKELLELERVKGGLSGVYIDCKLGRLNILRYQIERNLSALITNIMSVPSENTYSNISVKDSIENLKNRVIYTNNNEKSTYRVIRDNPASINTFGLLSTIEEVDTKKTNNLRYLAQTKLDELNKIETEIGLTLLGDYRVSKGKVLDMNVPEYTLSGTYLIKSANHTIDKTKEKIKISIERILNF